MHPLRLLLDLLPELLVEQRTLLGPRGTAAGNPLGHGFPRRGHRRAARQSRGPVPALSLPYHHELRQSLPEGPQPLRGDRRAQAEAGRTADLACVYRKAKPARSDGGVRPRWRTNLWDRIAEPAENSAYLCLETDGF